MPKEEKVSLTKEQIRRKDEIESRRAEIEDELARFGKDQYGFSKLLREYKTLWRDTKAPCLSFLGWTDKRTVDFHIFFADVIDILAPEFSSDDLPKNEAQTRPLFALRTPELIKQVWSVILEENKGKRITEKIVEEVVNRYLEEPQKPKYPSGITPPNLPPLTEDQIKLRDKIEDELAAKSGKDQSEAAKLLLEYEDLFEEYKEEKFHQGEYQEWKDFLKDAPFLKSLGWKSKDSAKNYIKFEKVKNILVPDFGNDIPQNQGQARPLFKLIDAPELMKQVWGLILEENKVEDVTAVIVKEVASVFGILAPEFGNNLPQNQGQTRPLFKLIDAPVKNPELMKQVLGVILEENKVEDVTTEMIEEVIERIQKQKENLILENLESLDSISTNREDIEPKSDSYLNDTRRRINQAIVQRQGQPEFRAALLEAYKGKCAITDCDAKEALEAAHIFPYRGEETNCPENGLLLRADIHTLFDRYLISIDPSTRKIVVSPSLLNTCYKELNGKKLKSPKESSDKPAFYPLDIHYQTFLRKQNDS